MMMSNNIGDSMIAGAVYGYRTKDGTCAEGVYEGYDGKDENLMLHFRDVNNGTKQSVLVKDIVKVVSWFWLENMEDLI
jgi:hypothetical protein